MCSSDTVTLEQSAVNNVSTTDASSKEEPTELIQQENKEQRRRVVHVIMEHFSFEMQQLLDDYLRNKTINTFDEFNKRYHEIGMEGHDLVAYETLLKYARDHPETIHVHAGFIPRKYARMLMQEGQEAVLERASEYLPISEDGNNNQIFLGTNLHFRLFESLLSGLPIITTKIEATEQAEHKPAKDLLERIFTAQLLKDVAMANKLNEIIDTHKDDKFLVIAGNGHVLHYCGVPERVLKMHPELSDETCVIVSASTKKSKGILTSVMDTAGTTPTTLDLIIQDVIDRFGPKGTNPADYIYFYESKDDFRTDEDY